MGAIPGSLRDEGRSSDRSVDLLQPWPEPGLDTGQHRLVVDLAPQQVIDPQAGDGGIAGGTQLRGFPREIMEACYKVAFELYEETAAKNPKFKKIYDSWKPFRQDLYTWFSVAEYRFDSFVLSQALKR